MAKSKAKPAQSAATPKIQSKSSPVPRAQRALTSSSTHRRPRAQTSTSAAPKTTRKAQLIALLTRPTGAMLDELVASTEWQVHSVRAALTHFKREGHAVTRKVDADGASRYHLTLA